MKIIGYIVTDNENRIVMKDDHVLLFKDLENAKPYEQGGKTLPVIQEKMPQKRQKKFTEIVQDLRNNQFMTKEGLHTQDYKQAEKFNSFKEAKVTAILNWKMKETEFQTVRLKWGVPE